MDRQFPPEIIELIVKASLDPFITAHWDSCFNHYSTLKNYSLLNSTWREICKPSLYKVVVLHSERAASEFVRVAAGQGGAIGGVELMDIWCGAWNDKRPTALLQCVPQLQSLILHDALFHAVDLTTLHRLTNLTLVGCTVAPPSPATRLPIRHLRTTSYTPSTSSRSLLTPDVLPYLRELDFTDTYSVDFTALVPQLSALQLNGESLVHSFPLALSPRLLSLLTTDFNRLLPSLNSLPPFLLLRAAFRVRHLVQALQYHVANPKTGVKTIFVDCHYDEKSGNVTEVNQLIVELGSKGIVVELGRFTFSEAIRRMDAILLTEKQAAERREWAGGRA